MHKKFHKLKTNHNSFRLRSRHNYLGLYTCIGTLGFLTLAMIFPLDVNSASATDSDSTSTRVELTIGDEEDFTPSSKLRAASASTISVSLATTTPLTVTPESAGTFSSGSTTVDVYTTSRGGYSLHVNSTSSATGSNRLTKTGDSAKYVSPASGAVTSSTMAKNTWGYTLVSGAGKDVKTASFKPVPLTQGATPVLDGTANTSGSIRKDQYTLGFGAKVDQTLPAGEYTSNVTVSVIAKPEPITSLMQLTYMQEMTTAICAGTPSPTGIGTTAALTAAHTEKQLIDERDGKAYWVTKMADGNCWMTQNLALDINGTKTYSGGFKGISSGSGVPVANTKDGTVKLWSGNASSSDRTGNLPKITESTTGSARNNYDNYDTRSWNFGDYALTTPMASQSCSGSSINQTQSLSGCLSVVTNVRSYTQIPYKVYGAGQGYKYTNSSVISGGNYDAHYLTGNYYQYNTAMAGSAGSGTISNYAIPNWSVCPAGADSDKNWKPAKSSNETNNDYAGLGSVAVETFANLLTKYGVTTNSPASSTLIQHLPLAFSRVGYVNTYYGTLSAVNGGGYYWSRTLDAYILVLTLADVNPASSTSNYLGLSLRCLYPGT